MRCALAFVFLAVSSVAHAQAPSTKKGEYSAYERETLATALVRMRTQIDPAPEGKILEGVDVVRLEVIDRESKPLRSIPLIGPFLRPELLNPLHATSKEWIVRRELLLDAGEPFQQTLLDETTRNLRRLKQLSLVIGVAVKGSAPDKVRVLIITKDIWSLRLSYDMSLGPGGLESLVIQPSEINVGGLHHTATTQFSLTPASYTLGAGYTVPRFGQSFVGASVSAAFIMNRERGEPEGSTGSFVISRPLYNTLIPWAWSARGDWTTNVLRRFVNAKLASFDAESTPVDDRIPFEYMNRRANVAVSLTRSFGWEKKTDLSFGYEYSRRQYRTFDRPGINQGALDEFQRRFVPTSDTRSSPLLQLHLYTTNYHRVTDVETLALQEDIRLGHEIYLQLYPVSQALGSTRNFAGSFVSAQYTVPLGNGFARVGAQATTEGTADELTDASVLGMLRVVTPKLPIGRFVLDLTALNRYRNYLNAQTYLGGDGRLRGFPSNYLVGKDYIVGNLEFRSRPVNLLSLQTGVVLFYDAGDAARSWRELAAKQAAGAGVRVLIPQLNRVVFRADLGFPLTRPLPPGASPASFFLSFEQAFDLNNVGPS